jgi:hypothetical protein
MHRLGLVALAAVFVLAGCASLAEPPSAYATPAPTVVMQSPAPTYTAPVVVMQSPPPQRVEVVPVAPGAAYVWAPGYWNWNGRSYYWVSGRYLARPYARSVWVPGRWYRSGNGWIFIAGHWA